MQRHVFQLGRSRRHRDILKGFYDSNREKIRLLVTGSSRLGMYRKSGDSLVGRYFSYQMFPLGLPEAAADFSFVLDDDLFLANGDALLREDLNCHHSTIGKWIDLLKEVYLVFTIRPWHRHIQRSLKPAFRPDAEDSLLSDRSQSGKTGSLPGQLFPHSRRLVPYADGLKINLPISKTSKALRGQISNPSPYYPLLILDAYDGLALVGPLLETVNDWRGFIGEDITGHEMERFRLNKETACILCFICNTIKKRLEVIVWQGRQ
jgi:hypothetical protein